MPLFDGSFFNKPGAAEFLMQSGLGLLAAGQPMPYGANRLAPAMQGLQSGITSRNQAMQLEQMEQFRKAQMAQMEAAAEEAQRKQTAQSRVANYMRGMGGPGSATPGPRADIGGGVTGQAGGPGLFGDANFAAMLAEGGDMASALKLMGPNEGKKETFGEPHEVTGRDGKPMLIRAGNMGTIQPITDYGPKVGGRDANEVYSLDPVWGTDDKGNAVLLQTSNRGGPARQVQLPPNVTAQPGGVQKHDLGTEWALTDRNGALIGRIPKDLRGAAAQTAGGRVAGEAQAQAEIDLPKVERETEASLKLLDDLIVHPGMKEVVGVPGFTSFANFGKPLPGTEAASFTERLGQIKGQQFLSAYQMLKGGGAITETEGLKAEQAIARMGTAQKETDFVEAAKEFQGIMRKGLEAARKKAGRPGTPETTGPKKIMGDSDYAKLKSGEQFIGPDGTLRVKP